MNPALIFLNGYYDARYLNFYRQEIEEAEAKHLPLICADGGLRIFHQLNQRYGIHLTPDILIGDLDSVDALDTDIAKHIVQEWIGQTDKDYTDGQLAVVYAIEQYDCQHIIIYGGLPRPGQYETEQFLGNLKLMRFGENRMNLCNKSRAGAGKVYRAEMRDARQTIHYVVSQLRLIRKNSGLQRVSLIAEEPGVVVENSENLRWNLASMHVDAVQINTLRNEFVTDKKCAMLQLAEGSAPVYVIHNWYDLAVC